MQRESLGMIRIEGFSGDFLIYRLPKQKQRHLFRTAYYGVNHLYCKTEISFKTAVHVCASARRAMGRCAIAPRSKDLILFCIL